jgi:hypothetical protein
MPSARIQAQLLRTTAHEVSRTPADGTLLAAQEEHIAERVLARRYGTVRALFERAMDVMRVDMCYLELTPDRASSIDRPD